MNRVVRISGRKKHSSVNGPGVRYVLFMQGCPHNCAGCQNPDTHDPDGGTAEDLDAVIQEILSVKYLDGITLSGGDPLMQPCAAEEIARAAKDAGLDVWLYTGWTFEEILSGKAGEEAKNVLPYLDVLVDGRFVLRLRDDGASKWRGSSNQRLIDVPASMAAGSPVLWNE